MAAKAHLRVGSPLVIAISTNDGLGMNLKNIGLLLNSKHIYFVPFGQDNHVKKPNSLVAHLELLKPTLELALEHKQYQPVLISYS
jgi:dipicolinate synthase subunit B